MLGFIDKAIQAVLWPFQRIGWWVSYLLRSERFQIRDGCLVRTGRFQTPDRIPITEIRRWKAYPEMVFDIVEIELLNGDVVRWLDCYDDLLSALRQAVREKEA